MTSKGKEREIKGWERDFWSVQSMS